MSKLNLLLFFSCAAFAQTPASHIIMGSTLPTKCSTATGDVWFKTSGTVGLYSCGVDKTFHLVALGAQFTARGAYSAGTTYAALDLVSDSSGVAYVSVQSSNTGHTPASSPSYWATLGVTGPQGIQGIPGTAGAPGTPGANGTNGAKGDKGDKGDTGSQGIQGIQGATGNISTFDTTHAGAVEVGSASGTGEYILTLADGYNTGVYGLVLTPGLSGVLKVAGTTTCPTFASGVATPTSCISLVFDPSVGSGGYVTAPTKQTDPGSIGQWSTANGYHYDYGTDNLWHNFAYQDTWTLAAPTFNNGTGTYPNDVSVAPTIPAGTKMCWRSDGTDPAESSPGTCAGSNNTWNIGDAAIGITATGTVLKGMTTESGQTHSGVTAATYTLTVSATVPSPGTGSYSSTQSVTLSNATASNTIRYTTDGSTPACPSTGTLYTGAISISSTTTLKAIGCKTNYNAGPVMTAVYTFSASYIYTVQVKPAALVNANPAVTTCTFSPAAQAGDLAVIFYVDSNSAHTVTVTDDKSSTYHTALIDTTSGYNLAGVVYAYNLTSGMSVVTITDSGAAINEGTCHLVHNSAGPYTSDPLDGPAPAAPVSSVLFTGTGSYTFPSLTPSQNDGIVITSVGEAAGLGAITWGGSGTGWTTGGNTSAFPAMFTQYYPNSTSTAFAPTITASGPTGFKFQGISVAFKHP